MFLKDLVLKEGNGAISTPLCAVFSYVRSRAVIEHD